VDCLGRSPNSFVKPFKYRITVPEWSSIEADEF